jgi:hypothetical protein
MQGKYGTFLRSFFKLGHRPENNEKDLSLARPRQGAF